MMGPIILESRSLNMPYRASLQRALDLCWSLELCNFYCWIDCFNKRRWNWKGSWQTVRWKGENNFCILVWKKKLLFWKEPIISLFDSFNIFYYKNICKFMQKKGKKSPEILSWREKSRQNPCIMHATIWVIFFFFSTWLAGMGRNENKTSLMFQTLV